MPRHLHAVPLAVSPETVAYLEQKLEQARAGELTGVLCVPIMKDGYSADVIGSARERPTLSRGMAVELFDRLREISARRRR